tara:strand:- start:743 stop:1135 length:393 start_codon:yes stop_codon:yes gene_type:complete
MKNGILTALIFMIFSCSANATISPHLSSEPIEVTNDELVQYWTMKFNSFSFNSEPKGKVASMPKGYVKIRYLIDSDGNTFNASVVESKPVGVWDEQGLLAIKQMQFAPTTDNDARVPVYVTTVFKFEQGN